MLWLAPNAYITGDVTCGPGVNLWFGAVVRGDVAPIILGENVNIQDGAIVHCDFGVTNTIEPGVVVGHAAVLHGARVGADSLIGIGAKLLSGSVIGPECIIAAGDTLGRCQGLQCLRPGDVCKAGDGLDCGGTSNNCCEGVFPDGGLPGPSFCNSGSPECCSRDALGIPRCRAVNFLCTPGMIVPAGQTCATSADGSSPPEPGRGFSDIRRCSATTGSRASTGSRGPTPRSRRG